MASLFLSPSTQEYNPYVTTGNEEYWMNLLADELVPYLEASGVNVTRNDPAGTVGASVRASNAGDYDFHLALHSNASPAATAGQNRGVDMQISLSTISARSIPCPTASAPWQPPAFTSCDGQKSPRFSGNSAITTTLPMLNGSKTI